VSVIKGKVIHDHELVLMSRSHGEWPFVRNETGHWVSRETGEECKAISLDEFLATSPKAEKETP
jgi:hypothetical protein